MYHDSLLLSARLYESNLHTYRTQSKHAPAAVACIQPDPAVKEVLCWMWCCLPSNNSIPGSAERMKALKASPVMSIKSVKIVASSVWLKRAGPLVSVGPKADEGDAKRPISTLLYPPIVNRQSSRRSSPFPAAWTFLKCSLTSKQWSTLNTYC